MCFSGIKVGYVFFFIFFLLLLEVGSGRKSFPLEKDMFLMESDTGQICGWPFVCFSGIKHISAYWVCAFFFFAGWGWRRGDKHIVVGLEPIIGSRSIVHPNLGPDLIKQ